MWLKLILEHTCQSTGVDVKQPRAFGNIQHRQSKQPVGGQDHDDNQHATTSYTSQELNFIPLEVDSGELLHASLCAIMYP